MAKSSIEKNIRQIEIVGICSSISILKVDLCDAYTIDPETIKVDIKDIKNTVPALHTKKFKIVTGDLSKNILFEKIDLYLRLRKFGSIDKKAIDNLIAIHKQKALFYIVAIFKQIENNLKITFIYKYPNHDVKDAEPLSLWLVNNTYRLLAKHDGIIKQYLLSEIKSIDFENQLNIAIKTGLIPGYFEIKELPKKPELEEYLKYSYGGWVSDKNFSVKIQLIGISLNSSILPDQEILTSTHNSTIIQGKVNSLDEFAKYVVTMAGRIIALEPPELVSKVKEIANKVLKAH